MSGQLKVTSNPLHRSRSQSNVSISVTASGDLTDRVSRSQVPALPVFVRPHESFDRVDLRRRSLTISPPRGDSPPKRLSSDELTRESRFSAFNTEAKGLLNTVITSVQMAAQSIEKHPQAAHEHLRTSLEASYNLAEKVNRVCEKAKARGLKKLPLTLVALQNGSLKTMVSEMRVETTSEKKFTHLAEWLKDLGMKPVNFEFVREPTDIQVSYAGKVYKCTENGTDTVFVVKEFDATDESNIVAFVKELIVLQICDHVNIVELHTFKLDPSHATLLLITRLCHKGSLDKQLKEFQDFDKAIGVFHDVALALQYIHRLNLLHRDVKAANVFITQEGRAVLGDLGSAGPPLEERSQQISTRWKAPDTGPETEKEDVFSFGIFIGEVLSGEIPFNAIKHGTVVEAMQRIALRPPLPRTTDSNLGGLIDWCCSQNPDQRPTIDEVISTLTFLHRRGPLNTDR